MITIETFRIIGQSPLVLHSPKHMLEEAMKPQKETVKSSKKKIPPPDVEAEWGCYRDPEGQIAIPCRNLRTSLIKGCRNRKLPWQKTTADGTAKTAIQAGVFVVDEWTLLFDPINGEPVTGYKQFAARVVVRGAGICRVRPRIDQWACDLRLFVDDDFIPGASVLTLFNIAGNMAGICDDRPERGGPHGRYKVQHLGGEPCATPAVAAE